MDEATKPGGPALVWANWYRFHPAQRIRHARVESVCFLWSVSGSGSVTSRGRLFHVEPGWILRLPWGHDVDYLAAGRQPFQLGTLHLIPHHRETADIELAVAHDRRPELLGSLDRLPGSSVESPEILSSMSSEARDFIALGAYCIDRFTSSAVSGTISRSMGALVIDAAGRLSEGNAQTSWPASLRAMTVFILEHLDETLSVATIAAAGETSPTTAQRLFMRHTSRSMMGWVRASRLDEAARLLRTTGLRVNEVARAVGFEDPLYFSRAFRDAWGVAPSKYGESDLAL